MMRALLQFWSAHRTELATLFAQHVVLVALSTVVAIAIGVPLGILAARRPRLASPLTALANIVQTVPSLAMFGFLLPVPVIGGVGARAALVVLILYGLLPIVRTTIAGIRGIDAAIVEAATAMGMTDAQRLRQIELPLALPSIVAGVRVAAVVGVGSATIAAAIGAGGLGEYIYRGLSMVDTTVILAGAIPAAILAIAVDLLLLWIERQLSTRRRRSSRAAVVAAAVILAGILLTSGVAAHRSGGAIVVGSKNFTEQLVLGELVAQAIESEGIVVDRRLNLGGTLICDRALMTGDVDVYVEYTGTALTAIFHQPIANDSSSVYATVRDFYARSGRTLLPPLGFNNTFAILVRGEDARSLGLTTIDDAARQSPHWRAGFGYEFVERPDGFPGLAQAYGLHFPNPPLVMDLTLSYRALASHQVDVIAGDATAGLIKGLDLVQLADNRHYFPPYDAAPVARAETLLRYPAVRTALEKLANRISADDMRAMNYAADVEHRDIRSIVGEFLRRYL
ncbi:MAG TPA: ABC transporter permease/substrate-binding protein [Vicinamibacterales bacterium]|nr:ABC transporter permease/substrate-binding protein [Vicinamibacterales bacterium]